MSYQPFFQTLYDSFVLIHDWKDRKTKQLRIAKMHASVACVYVNVKKPNANINGGMNRKRTPRNRQDLHA